MIISIIAIKKEGIVLTKLRSCFRLFDKNINILIVEDEIIAMAMQSSLEKIGYTISGIEFDVKSALLHAQSNKPDIVIMDINIDKGLGIETANEIWNRFKIPIIFLTSYSNERIINKVLECGSYAYLMKPCKDKELRATIKMVLNKHKYFFSNKKSLSSEKSEYILIDENLKFDKVKIELFKKDVKVRLTKNEKKLFEVLSQKEGEVIDFKQISTYIWKEDFKNKSKLRMLVYRLRQKLNCNPLENFYEWGYRLKLKKKIV